MVTQRTTEELHRKHLVVSVRLEVLLPIPQIPITAAQEAPGSQPHCVKSHLQQEADTHVFFRVTANPLLLDNKASIPSAIRRTHPVVGPWIPDCQQDTLSQYEKTRRLSSGCDEEHRRACRGSLILTRGVQFRS